MSKQISRKRKVRVVFSDGQYRCVPGVSNLAAKLNRLAAGKRVELLPKRREGKDGQVRP